jgi:hypothetical protein
MLLTRKTPSTRDCRNKDGPSKRALFKAFYFYVQLGSRAGK